jgi:DNA-binding GntR family transcriptional regulator
MWRVARRRCNLKCQMPVPQKSAAISRRLLHDVAYTALRQAILDGTLAPGKRLRDTELCAWLELSKTPVC